MNLWTDHHASTIDPARFRAHDQYLEQSAAYPYHELTRWARQYRADWLDAMTEDGAFGCTVATAAEGKTVSRDLLDSIAELDFLDRYVPNLATARVLDIGAGYGRLAHRLTTVSRTCSVVCTDAIDVSRAVCATYLDHRGIPFERAHVTHPDVLNDAGEFDLACNVHSWSECSLDEVRGWLDWLAPRVKRIFIVPHTPSFGTYSAERGGGNGPSYVEELHARGYSATVMWGGPDCCPRTYSLWERA